MKRLALAFFLLSIAASLRADEIIWPLDCKHQITSSFGEFRVGHIHAGIDFRTPDGEGMPIIAPEDGEVVRVRQSPWGYGRVIYLRMADNRIAVFAHLSGFADSIDARVRKKQIDSKSSTVELWFERGELRFVAGDTLGFSGSSGAGSPHLHFEVRDGFDSPFNPGYLGYVTGDEIPPKIAAVWAVPFGDNSNIDGHYRPVRFDIDSDKLEFCASGEFYIAIEAFDLESADNVNRFGIHDIALTSSQDTLYHFFADTFSYSRTRQIGLIYDLGIQEEFGLKRPPFRLFHPFGADVALLKNSFEGIGILRMDGDTLHLAISAADVAGNRSSLQILVEPIPKEPVFDVKISHVDNAVVFETDLAPEESLGLRFEFERDGKMFRERIPTKGAPTTLKSVDYARIRRPGFAANPLFLWRPGGSKPPSIAIDIPGTDYILVRANFDEPPTSIPVLIRSKDSIRPEIESDTSFVFRIFGTESGENMIFALDTISIEFDPGIFAVEGGAKIDLAGGRARLKIPKGGVFTPFCARDTILPTDDGGEIISIQPAGAMLRSKATFTMLSDSISSDERLCIIRLWEGDTFFVSASRNKKGDLFAKIGAFGDFAVAIDSIPPKLKLRIDPGATVRANLAANVSDDLSGFSNDILPQSYIDGEWSPVDYDSDKESLKVDVGNLPPGEHVWLLIATDIVGNSTQDSVKFIKH